MYTTSPFENIKILTEALNLNGKNHQAELNQKIFDFEEVHSMNLTLTDVHLENPSHLYYSDSCPFSIGFTQLNSRDSSRFWRVK